MKIRFYYILMCIIFLFTVAPVNSFAEKNESQQQPITVKGTIVDIKKEPLIGVSVRIKGTNIGVTTNIDGQYSINAPNKDAVLTFSYLGYAIQEVKLEGRTVIDVTMSEDAQLLEEVVVVGYGTQKKVNLSGSVATVGADKLANRPAMNLTTTLDGLAPGVRVTQSRGNPGDEGVSIRIRGTSSFNDSSPLILVDGVAADMSVLNTEDVESISILKDAAAAAIYGSRAANGVILVTTKKGSNEKPKVTFSGLFAQEKAVTDLKFMSSTADFMEYHNVARINATPSSTTPDYKVETINEWRAADANPNGIYTNPVNGQTIPNWLAYPNTDWAQILFKPEYYQKYNLAVSGGGQTSSYLLSLGYQDNPGTLKNTGMQRFNIRANVESKIADFITFGTQTYATKEYKEPGSTSMTYLLQAFPGITPMYDGKYGASEDPNTTNKDNILQQVASNGGQLEYTRINTSWYTNIQLPLKGLVAEAKFNYSEYDRKDNTYSQYLPRYSFRESLETPKEGKDLLSNATTYRYSYGSNSYTADLLLRYNNTFGKHDVSGLFGYEQYRTESSGFNAQKKGLLDWTVTDITSAAEMVSIDGSSLSEYAMLSYFGRVNYVYDSRYMFEANFRSDASSKFAPGYRSNLFPSASAAWRISEESFFESVKPYVNYLKLKASYGTLGNTVSGNYDWQTLYKKVNNVFDERVQNGLIQQTIQNLGLSWEKVTTYNVGLDAHFLDQRLSTELEGYYRRTDDILASGKIYMTMGNISAPMENTASMGNKGLEVTLNWNDRIGEFKYGAGINATYNINNILDFRGNLKYELDETVLDVWGKPTWRYTNLGDATTGGDNIRTEGRMIDEYFLRKPYSGNGSYNNADGTVNPKGGPKDGMIRTKADLEWVKSMIAAGYSFDSKTVAPGAANIWYGQVLMADMNGDGRYGNSDDREFLGKSTVPKWTFGLTLNAEWKGIDMSMIWSGRAGSYHYINERGANGAILSNVGDGIPADAKNMFYSYDAVAAYNDFNGGAAYDPASDPNANIHAKYPRLLAASSIMQNSTFYLYNTSFLKLKSLQIGYTLPKKWMAHAKISNLRVFFSGENLMTIKSDDFPGVDPELGGSIIVYPIARLLSGGLSVTF